MVVKIINNIHSKVVKLIKALKQYDEIYISGKKQYFSPKNNKVFSIVQLRKIITLEEYLKIKPDYKGEKEYHDVVVMESFREVDILLKLAEIYKEVKSNE